MSTTLPAETAQRPAGGIGNRLVVVMAVATGLAVANMYYAQPLLPDIERSVHVSSGVAGLLVTVSQIGYAGGLALLLPLGDLVERRRLISLLCLGMCAALILLALSPYFPLLIVGATAVGALAVTAQMLVPFAAGLAAEHERGRVVGNVMSGLLLGILLARTVAGLVAAVGGWRAIYVAAAVAMALQALVLYRELPTSREPSGLSYPALLASVVRIFRDEPLLRLRSALGALGFMSFSVLWTSMAFLLAGAPYHYGSAVIGLFGLAGAAGAGAASLAGRLADRALEHLTTVVATGLLAICWLPMWLGRHSLVWLLVGIVVLDLATQALQITNQSVIYRLQPQARSRITSAYMTCYFVAGAIASALSAAAYDGHGWAGVCVVGLVVGVSALATGTYALLHHERPRDPADAVAGPA